LFDGLGGMKLAHFFGASPRILENQFDPRGHGAAVESILACTLLFGKRTRRCNCRRLVDLLVFLVALTGGVPACGKRQWKRRRWGRWWGVGGRGNPGTTAGTDTVTVTDT
jgi:hypothetical protein